MAEVDYLSIQRELKHLEPIAASFNRWSLLSPTRDVYDKLASGDEHDLQTVVDLMSHHLNLARIPSAKYDWSFKIPVEAAGEIRNPGTVISVIRIPFAYVGKPYAIGAILAHEMCHQALALAGVWYSDINENEKLTDVATLAVGFGKLVLNGLALEASGVDGMSIILGYIEPEAKLFSYLLTCRHHGISMADLKSHLAKDVVVKLEDFYSQNREIVP